MKCTSQCNELHSQCNELHSQCNELHSQCNELHSQCNELRSHCNDHTRGSAGPPMYIAANCPLPTMHFPQLPQLSNFHSQCNELISMCNELISMCNEVSFTQRPQFTVGAMSCTHCAMSTPVSRPAHPCTLLQSAHCPQCTFHNFHHFPLSTFHFPLSTFHFPLSTHSAMN
jgi:hypothetical protein